MVAQRYERTAPDFPTYGPPEGGSWHDYFKELANIKSGTVTEFIDEDGIRQVVASSEVEQVVDLGIQIVTPQHEITGATDTGEPNTIGAYRKLLFKNNWEFKVGHSRSFEAGKVYGPDAQKAGQKRADKYTDVYFINARKSGKGYVDLSFHVVNGISKPMTRMINKRLEIVSDKELKDWITS